LGCTRFTLHFGGRSGFDIVESGRGGGVPWRRDGACGRLLLVGLLQLTGSGLFYVLRGPGARGLLGPGGFRRVFTGRLRGLGGRRRNARSGLLEWLAAGRDRLLRRRFCDGSGFRRVHFRGLRRHINLLVYLCPGGRLGLHPGSRRAGRRGFDDHPRSGGGGRGRESRIRRAGFNGRLGALRHSGRYSRIGGDRVAGRRRCAGHYWGTRGFRSGGRSRRAGDYPIVDTRGLGGDRRRIGRGRRNACLHRLGGAHRRLGCRRFKRDCRFAAAGRFFGYGRFDGLRGSITGGRCGGGYRRGALLCCARLRRGLQPHGEGECRIALLGRGLAELRAGGGCRSGDGGIRSARDWNLNGRGGLLRYGPAGWRNRLRDCRLYPGEVRDGHGRDCRGGGLRNGNRAGRFRGDSFGYIAGGFDVNPDLTALEAEGQRQRNGRRSR